MVSIRQARERTGMALTSAASCLDITYINLGRYERGERQLPVQVAQGLGILYGINWWDFYPDYYPHGLVSTK